jgi:hypothetical protein
MITVKIRHKMPETNSSSSHSLAIYRNNPRKSKLTLKLDDKNEVTIPNYPDGFGWGWEYILDPGVRACYVISCICGLFSRNTFSKHKDKFEKIIKDYTGAVKVNYEWAPNGDTKTLRDLAPCVDHQSISDMYEKINISEDSMRDFIFSNQSHLIIGGEDVTPLNIMLSENPHADYKVFITLRLLGEREIGKDITVKLEKWPGGEKIRDIISDFTYHFYYSSDKNSFVMGNGSWYDPEKEKEGNYNSCKIFYEDSEARYYREKSSIDKPIEIDTLDYKVIKFDITRL